MSSTSDEQDNQPRWRTYDWVSNKTFAALPFYRAGWKILKRDWLVFVWKLIADAIARFSSLFLGVFVFVLLAVDFGLFIGADNPPLLWIERLGELVRSTGFIAGVFGSFFVLGLLVTAIQALVVGGIWGLLRDGLHDEEVHMGATFLRRGVELFPDVLSLFLVRYAARIVVVMLGAALAAATFNAITTGALADLAGWQITLFFAAAVTSYLFWAALVRLAFEVAGAPLILDDTDLGEAILRAANFTLDNFWSIYRLLIWALGILLVPLGIYFVFIMINNLALIWPVLEPIGAMLRLAGEAILFVATTIVIVLFYGALFAFYHHDDTRVDPVEGEKFPWK